MSDEAALFPAADVEVRPLCRAELVNARCSWGDELGRVVSARHENGFPVIEVELIRFPARVVLSPANVTPVEQP